MKEAPHSAAARNAPLNTVYSGAMFGTIPSSVCASAMSRIALVNRRDASNSYRSDGPFRCNCSIQPSFSRCGQSVITDTRLDRCAQRTRSRMRFSKGLAVAKVPTGEAEECTMTPSIETSRGRRAGSPAGACASARCSTLVGGTSPGAKNWACT
ncbi:MAG: hypothetical protein H6Q10_3766 [Acidobacteria bacterium]|nr:hypothetical protein [Acidobacteriota bacterium]